MENRDSRTIGLALSGGGFRATLFHLGVVRLLFDAKRLSDLRQVTAVSGGSILAAHLGANWARYTGSVEEFEQAASELIAFTRSDVRGRIVRRWMMAWLLVVPGLLSALMSGLLFVLGSFPTWLRWTLLSVQLQRAYAALFKNKNLAALPLVPEFRFLSTSMTTGSSWSFARDGVRYKDVDNAERHIQTTTLPLSYAVAASSAFPPMFPPIQIDHDILAVPASEFDRKEYLTDGGVYDNLGIECLVQMKGDSDEPHLLLVSNAGGRFDWTKRAYRFVLGRNVRASDLLMHRVGKLQWSALHDRTDLVHLQLGMPIAGEGDAVIADPGTQRRLSNIRTDLDAFSAREIVSLIYQGYAAARQALFGQGDAPQCTWTPVAEFSSVAALQWDSDDIRRAERRKWRLWQSSDAVSWLNAAMVFLWMGIIAAPIYVQRAQIIFLEYQNRQISSATASVSPSMYVRRASNDAIVVFLHGLFGDTTRTWTCSTTGKDWPTLLTEDRALDRYDVYTAGFSSPLYGAGLSFDEASRNVYETLARDGVFESHSRVTFVTHDLGASIVKRVLLDHRDLLAKTASLVSYGESEVAPAAARILSWNVFGSRLLSARLPSSNEMRLTASEWQAANPTVEVRCAYETRTGEGWLLPALVRIGPPPGCTGEVVAIDSDHAGIVKPCEPDAPAYVFLRSTLLSGQDRK